MLGILAMVQTFLMFTTIITTQGTNVSILRLMPEHIAKYSATSAFKIYSKIQLFIASISILTSFILFSFSNFIASFFFSKPHLSFYLALASWFVVFRSLMELNTQAVRGLRLIRVFALMQIMPSGSAVLALIILSLLNVGQNSAIYAHLASFVITTLIGVWVMNHSFKQMMQPNDIIKASRLYGILKISTPMLFASCMQFIIANTGIILLGIFRSVEEVGYYAVALSISSLGSIILASINSMTAPTFSDLYHKGAMDELFYVAKKSTRLIFFITAPILLLLVLLGKPLLSLLFGQPYATAYPALAFLVIGQFVNSISGSTGIFMNMTGHQFVFRNVMIVSGTINIILSLVLIPLFGITGAACTGMITLFFWNIYLLLFIKNKYGLTIGYLPFLMS